MAPTLISSAFSFSASAFNSLRICCKSSCGADVSFLTSSFPMRGLYHVPQGRKLPPQIDWNFCHCELREAIQRGSPHTLDCFALLAMPQHAHLADTPLKPLLRMVSSSLLHRPYRPAFRPMPLSFPPEYPLPPFPS